MTEVRVGTRASMLALTQTRLFCRQLADLHDDLTITEVHISTEGDRSTAPLSHATTPGLFVSALRDELRRTAAGLEYLGLYHVSRLTAAQREMLKYLLRAEG